MKIESPFFDHLPVGLVTLDRRLRVRRVNQQGRLLLAQQRRGGFRGRRLLDALGQMEPAHQELLQRLSQLRAGQCLRGAEVLVHQLNGESKVLQVDAVAHRVRPELTMSLVDVTHWQREAQTDPLTGLLNRAGGHQRLQQALQAVRPPHTELALMALDVDGLKPVNDRWGHAAGDTLLKTLALRLRAQALPPGWAARVGGDEFVLGLPAVPPGWDAQAWGQQVIRALSAPMVLAGRAYRPAASAGVVRFPTQAQSEDELMRLADSALYRAKRSGGGCACLADPQLDRPT